MGIANRHNLLKAALTVAAMLALFVLAPTSSAQTGPVVSVDALPDAANTATTLGPIDYCRSVPVGATFNVDIVIQDVSGITGLEGHLLYNPAALRVTAVDYAFLIGSAGGARVELGDPTPDTDGDFELGVVTFPLVPASGSAVLARVTLEALAAGNGPLDLKDLKLSDSLGNPILPADSVTGVFTGVVNDASLAVGSACADPDGDGYTSTTETWLGTDPLDNCGNHRTTAPIYSMAWPADLYSVTGSIPSTTDKVTIQDLTSFLAPVRIINASPGDLAYNVRWDLVPGKGLFSADINIQDLTSLLTAAPPMFGGVRAFNGPACTP